MKLTNPKPVFLLFGTPGSGKTSVAQALLQYSPFGLHLPLDDFREFVVSGRASVFDWSDETTRQFALARAAAVATAVGYAEAGFAVALDDVVFPTERVPGLQSAASAKTGHSLEPQRRTYQQTL